MIVGDMQLRNIGIIGYGGVFPVATFLLALLVWKTEPFESNKRIERTARALD